ncbi:chemotaxis protein CheB [Novosphingobium sp. AAP83]|uniref:chemotaxis protein CheB n=1 Tax=Novosphingobium sp. AAP83 TaxID=1523425 RepID=UPI001E5F0B0E|nr:chemotaxis protein CheB [Novosphingobium sp. AAP83]
MPKPPRQGPTIATNSASALTARSAQAAMSIIAIGASAGGLEAASKLLDGLPATSGMAFIIVQHLDPTHKSMMAELLAKHSAMTIIEACNGGQLSPDHVYIIPPGRFLSVRAGVLHLTPKQTQHGTRLPYDCLLKSLAKMHGPQTTAIVLTGTGADGSGALAALKAAGGHVIAQLPEEAEYDGMPRAAIATGLVDQILALADIPAALIGRQEAPSGKTDPSREQPVEQANALAAIITLLKDRTAHDFTQYKSGTMARRIERRMGLLALERSNLVAYLELLNDNSAECDLLVKDLLINVTSFFRDPGVFEALEASAIPELIERLTDHQALRVWVAGCSTGEEAYSIAMTCRDAIEASGRNIKLQVFASDVDADAIATARDGFYPHDIASAVSAKRLARNFNKDDAGYRVTASLRGDVVFTVQDLLSDPPFSKIDLISCRNLLIYLNNEAQTRVISLFHFALRESGVLVLGSSETIGNSEDRFEPVAESERIYRHIARSRSADARNPLRFGETLPSIGASDRITPLIRQTTLADICRTGVLTTLAPTAILINQSRHCVYSMGPVERYLRIPSGYATLDVLAMATPALRTKLRLAIDAIGPKQKRVDGGKTRLTHDGATIWFRIDVQALKGDHEDLILVCFIEEHTAPSGKASSASRSSAPRVAELELELEATRAELQTAILHQERSSQEQKAINEEALSVNEEFQSTNEELLTSKEELQSLNEELTALNSQLQETLERQRLTSDDLQNVLYSTNVGTLFLDMELRIRFYTPAIKSLFSIIAGDIGRPLADLQPIAADYELIRDARQVLIDEALIEREIEAPDDIYYSRRIFPYRAHNDKVEGVVITFADITDRKITAKALETAKLEAERANVAKSRFLSAASHDLRQPLQSLTLLQELLTRSVQGEKPKRLLARLEQTIGSMSGMLNALLDINQIEAGIVEAEHVLFPVNSVLNSLREEFTHLAQSRNLTLHILDSAAIIKSDPALLSQMIRNLLGNAIKYTLRGKILLGCRRRGNSLRIEVWDSGIGIAADQLHAIFDEFHQVDNVARERSLGLGLGLSIVQRLGRLLGHDVDVRSKPDKGSVFTVTIADLVTGTPLTEDCAPTVESESVAQQRPCKILLVDDDPDVLELLEQLLKGEGHSVKSATSAAEALEIVAGGAMLPEILLTDYSLPGGTSGLELVQQLRERLSSVLPAIILSGDVSSETLAKVAAQDCMQLSKPVKPRELLAAIERLCAEHGSLPV